MNQIILNNENLTQLLTDQRQDFLRLSSGTTRQVLLTLSKQLNNPYVIVISGLRRSGKSTLLRQLVEQKIKDDFYYVNFDDERLITFQADQFSQLETTLMTEFGHKKYYIFDEVQNVEKWEIFVRRLHNQGKKVLVTGSNSALLSQELGSRLTGRHLVINLFPFSFTEYLKYKDIELIQTKSTEDKVRYLKSLKRYLIVGGIPLSLEYPRLDVVKQLYQDILQRDIIRRFGINSDRELQEFSLNLVTNTASLISLNKLKQVVKIASVTTLSNYLDYLSKSWLFGVVNRFSYSVKTQQIAPKKVYVADPAFINQVGFTFSNNLGKIFETIIYWDLIRANRNIYYYKTKKDSEVDFYLPKENRFIQVSVDTSNPETYARETKALEEARAEISSKPTTQIVTLDNYIDFKA